MYLGLKDYGCYKDCNGERGSTIFRFLPFETGSVYQEYANWNKIMTPQLCQKVCFEQLNYTFAGVQYMMQCWCGNVEPSSIFRVSNSKCNLPCSGDKTQMCGNSCHSNIYGKDQAGKLLGTSSKCLLNVNVHTYKESFLVT